MGSSWWFRNYRNDFYKITNDNFMKLCRVPDRSFSNTILALTIAVAKESKYRAKPSFSQKLSHQATVMVLPNHMWHTSCNVSWATACCLFCVHCLGSTSIIVSWPVNKPTNGKLKFHLGIKLEILIYIPQFSIPPIVSLIFGITANVILFMCVLYL